MNRKLGRKAVKHDSRTLMLARYLGDALAPPPLSIDWTKGIASWGALLNNTLGDCTIAGVGHAVQVWTANTDGEAVITDEDALSYYEKWDGYNPEQPGTDNGGVELDVLTAWKRDGFAGHALTAFAAVSPRNVEAVKQAIALFGGCYIGMDVPNYIMAGAPQVWSVEHVDTGIAGGHCVYVVGYDAATVTFISWGLVYRMTWEYWAKYVDEAYALLSPCFLEKNGLDPAGFNLEQLTADLARIS